MKIAFRLDANNEIGMGHAVRCSALAEMLTDRGCVCAYFCRDNSEIRTFAASRRLGFKPVPCMELSGELQWMRDALAGYDAVVIDSYFVSDDYIDRLNRPGFTVVCYDDNALYEYSCDAVINGNLHAPGLNFRLSQKKPKLLLGGKYTLLRHEFKEAAPIELREHANRLFICFGGSDVRNFTPKAVAALKEIPGIEIVAVLGAMTECDDEVYAASGKNIQVIKNPPSMAKIMSECDIAVVAGGSTVYELAVLGIPSIIIVQADNQEQIAGFLDKNGLMKYIGDWRTVDIGLLKNEATGLLSDFERRQRESSALKNAISRNGAGNAADELLRIMAVNKENAHS